MSYSDEYVTVNIKSTQSIKTDFVLKYEKSSSFNQIH